MKIFFIPYLILFTFIFTNSLNPNQFKKSTYKPRDKNIKNLFDFEEINPRNEKIDIYNLYIGNNKQPSKLESLLTRGYNTKKRFSSPWNYFLADYNLFLSLKVDIFKSRDIKMFLKYSFED